VTTVLSLSSSTFHLLFRVPWTSAFRPSLWIGDLMVWNPSLFATAKRRPFHKPKTEVPERRDRFLPPSSQQFQSIIALPLRALTATHFPNHSHGAQDRMKPRMGESKEIRNRSHESRQYTPLWSAGRSTGESLLGARKMFLEIPRFRLTGGVGASRRHGPAARG